MRICLDQKKLVEKKKMYNASTNKENFVYPLLYRDYQQELAKTRASISKFQQLYSIGTGGDYNYADSQVLFHKAFDLADIICGKSSNSTQVIRKTAVTSLNQSVSVGHKIIGNGNRAYIVAEAGLNHNGNLDFSYELIKQAKFAGADIVKFQLGWRDKPNEMNQFDRKRISQLIEWSKYFEIELLFSIISDKFVIRGVKNKVSSELSLSKQFL